MSKEEGHKGLFGALPRPSNLVFEVDEVIVREKGVEMISLTAEEFISRFNELVFIGKDGKKTVYVRR